MTPIQPQFGYAGKWVANPASVQQAAYLVKSDPTPVGVETSGNGWFRVVSANEYMQAAQGGRLTWTA